MHSNLDKAREAMRRWRERNPELRRERNRGYKRAAYRRDPAMAKAQRADYIAKHPEVKRAREQAYRARKTAAAGSFTGAEWRALLDKHGNACAYCGSPAQLEAADHRVPLSRGGTNFIDNIVPACRSCNGRKHKMTEDEFRARLAAERGCDHAFDRRMNGLKTSAG